ncbi:MAG TPA: proton-conducting transporter membrane subunit, partial [Fibrobacteraceae bacterium]|nr:proton-conducting transporter membrane subunit [Fibrobacteraceae bacterium]
RRILAFSAVANAGYLVLALLVGDPGTHSQASLSALSFYLVSYAISSALALAGLSVLAQPNDQGDELGALRGAARRSPWIGSAVTLGVVSLAGLPPVVGFIAKFRVLTALVSNGHLVLAAIAMILATVAAVYYLRLALALWQEPAESDDCVCANPLLSIALFLGTLSLLVLTFAPGIVAR